MIVHIIVQIILLLLKILISIYYLRSYPVVTQRLKVILWRSAIDPHVWNLQETFCRLSGINRIIDNIMMKLYFWSNSPCITYLFLFFTKKDKYSKVLNVDVHGTSTGRSWETSPGPNDGSSSGHPRVVDQTSSFNSMKFKLTLTS